MSLSKFGKEFETNWPQSDEPLKLTDFGKSLLEKCKVVRKPNDAADEIDIQEFMAISSEFPIEFGNNSCRVLSQTVGRHGQICQQIASAYPVIHERTLALYLNFLEHKCQYGTRQELAIFRQLTVTDLVQRLLVKRCVSFCSRNDKHLLISNEFVGSGFQHVGTEAEKAPLLIQQVLSYDEIKLSALLSVSSHTEFINNIFCVKCGTVEDDKSKIEPDGVVVGIIGARLLRRDFMEYQDIILSRNQNIAENGYGYDLEEPGDTKAKSYRRVWKQFYEEADFLFADKSIDSKRFGNTRNKNDIFDNLIMKKRYTISFDTLLLECEARAAAANKRAYLHVVGIGLGVWKVAPQQEEIFLGTFEQRLKQLMPKLSHINYVDFSRFSVSEFGSLKHEELLKSKTHPYGGIRIFFSKRSPADKLSIPEDDTTDLLLVVSYPWDGNALPGNEFWMHVVKSTGASKIANCSLITELHNPHINGQFVNGANLRIVSEKYGLLHIAEYAEKVLA